MNMNMIWIHGAAGLCLLLVHTVFVLRSGYLLRTGRGPGIVDRWLMNGSRFLFPVVLLSLVPVWKVLRPLHVLCSFMPLLMMVLLFRRSRRRRYPMLLPVLNEFWFGAAVLTGGFL